MQLSVGRLSPDLDEAQHRYSYADDLDDRALYAVARSIGASPSDLPPLTPDSIARIRRAPIEVHTNHPLPPEAVADALVELAADGVDVIFGKTREVFARVQDARGGAGFEVSFEAPSGDLRREELEAIARSMGGPAAKSFPPSFLARVQPTEDADRLLRRFKASLERELPASSGGDASVVFSESARGCEEFLAARTAASPR